MILLDLVHNIALLVTLIVSHQMLTHHWRRKGIAVQALTGLLFGAVGLIGMMTPVHWQEGIIFDGRTIVLAVSGLFGGPVAASIAGVMCGWYRWRLSGGGVWMGLATIVEASACGVVFHYLAHRDPRYLRPLALLGLGMLVHVLMLLATHLLPGDAGAKARHDMGPTILIAYPIATMVVGMVFADGQARRAAEDSLRESEERYRSYVNNAPDAVFVMDDNGRYIETNPAASRLTGYSRDELLTLRTHDLLPPGLEPEADEYLRRVRAEGRSYAELPFRRKDGSSGWRSLSATRLSETRILGFSSDVSERKAAEEALRRSEERFRSMAEQMRDLLFLAGPDGALTYASPAAEPLLGWPPEGIVGRKLEELVTPVDAPRVGALLAAIVERNTPCTGVSLQFLRRDGAEFTGELVATRLVSEDRPGVAGIVRDVTERLALEAQLRQAQRMESVGRLAGGVAHDFNNMLAVIIGHAELAMDALDDPEAVRECVEQIGEAGQRSATLVRQLLAFARQQAICPVVLNLNETVGTTLKMLRRLVGEGIDISWNPGPGLWPVFADPGQVDQIVANLAVNARDAMSGVGLLEIGTENVTLDAASAIPQPSGPVTGEYVVLSVRDTGVGMDRATLERIYEPFFSTKEVGQGTGLGLAMVYGIVKQHGGIIGVESEPGVGTAFRVYLPRAEAQAEPETSPEAEAPPVRGTETILLVEDEAMVLGLARALLEGLGYTVLCASNPEEALRLVAERSPALDLLITDVVMPGMSGLELAERLRADRPTLRCLCVSGYTDDILSRQGVSEPEVRLLEKPFSSATLAATVREVLDEEDSLPPAASASPTPPGL